jgi:hypothetical protein
VSRRRHRQRLARWAEKHAEHTAHAEQWLIHDVRYRGLDGADDRGQLLHRAWERSSGRLIALRELMAHLERVDALHRAQAELVPVDDVGNDQADELASRVDRPPPLEHLRVLVTSGPQGPPLAALPSRAVCVAAAHP